MKIKVLAVGNLVHDVWVQPFIAISDVHENSAGRHDNCQARLLLAFLLAHSPAKWDLMILGDWRDFWEDLRGAAILSNNDWLERRIAMYRTVVLWGNHDDVPGLSPAAYELEANGLFAWHGHQLDPACRGRGRLGKAASLVWAVLERLWLGRALRGVKDRVVRAAHRRIKTAAVRGADNEAYIADAHEREKVLYMVGHTHKPELVDMTHKWTRWGKVEFGSAPGRWFANCGSWVKPGHGYAVRVDGRKVELLEITR